MSAITGRFRSNERGEEFGERNAEGAGHFVNVDERDVLLAAFDRTDIGSVQAAPLSQFFL